MSLRRLSTLLLASFIATGVAAPPIPAPDSYSAVEDTQLVIPAATGVLFNDNPNGHPQIEASVVTQPAHGTLILYPDGSFVYTPAANYNGPDSFTYRARNFIPPVVFDIDPAQSTANVAATVHAPLINQTRNDTSRVDGTVTAGILDPKTTGPFSLIQLTGMNAMLIDPMEFHYSFFLIGTADITSAANAISLSILTPGSPAPVNGAGVFSQTGNTVGASGTLHVEYSTTFGSGISDETLNNESALVDFNNSSVISNGTTITLTMPLSFTRNGIVVDAANNVTADIVITGTLKATAPAAQNVAEESTPVTVTLNVAAVNDAPVAVADSYYTRQAAPVTISAAPPQSTEELVPAGSIWKYRYDGVNYGTAWKEWAFNDSAWLSGPALLGHGDPDIVTSIRPGGSPNYATAYFRREFNISNTANTRTGVKLYIKRDDGAAVYLNGVQIYRDANLPAAADFDDYTTSAIPGADENIFVEVNVSRSLLFEGKNVLAVEIHQSDAASSDVRFDCRFTRPLGAPGVLANDSDVDTAPAGLSVSLLQEPAHGTVTLNANGGFTYTPASGFIGDDSFAYGITDGGVGTSDQIIVPRGSAWKYLADGTNPGATWRDSGFDDSLWFTGLAELGYGDGDEFTLLPSVPVHPTYFFRQKFTYSGDKAFVNHLVGRIRRDDAAAVYLNGEEVYRDASLPQNPAFDFYSVVSTPSETVFAEFIIPASKLLAGENTIAVEVHQASSASSDVSFDFELSTILVPGARATVTVLNDDFDLDGMSDTWERANGFNYGSAADAVQDTDFDGVINRLEFLALTNPRSITSVLASGTPTRAGGNLVLTFSGLNSGRSYQLESSTNLADWPAVGVPFVPSGASTVINVPFVPTVPKKVYRLRVNYSFP
jgi:Bacterial Ig domain